MSDEAKPLGDVKDWLDEQEFYEYCQRYRHSQEGQPPFMPTPAEAFEALKKYIRDQVSVAGSIKG